MSPSARLTADQFDAIVVGAGHNGLATAVVLARNGQRVLVLEKNDYVGGMGGTREILKGCKNEVGATCLFPLSSEIKAYFDFPSLGVELIPLPIMAVNLTTNAGRPLLFCSNPLRLSYQLLKGFGPGAMLGFFRLLKFCEYPARVLDRFTARKAPRRLDALIAEAPTKAKREQLELAFKGSAMDIIDKFFPDPVRHRELRANMAFAAVQATYKGPYTPGSGLCLIYTMAQEGSEGMMQRVRGGMGQLSEALVGELDRLGSEVRLKHAVKRILVEDNRATGIELKNGQRLFANVIISNLDKPATFHGLLNGHTLPIDTVQRIDKFEHRGAFVHMLFKLRGLPTYNQRMEALNRDPQTRFGGAMVIDPESMQAAYEACQRGELPEEVPLAFQIPTVMDPSLAPPGKHIASAYGFYFPCDAPKEERGKLRDRMGQRIIDQITEHMPDFAELIEDTAIFSSDHFGSMHGVSHGDWTHGLLHPDQMIGDRCLVDGTGHVSTVENLFLCGASCHPGPGVTFLPGYNCAFEVMAHTSSALGNPSHSPAEHAA